MCKSSVLVLGVQVSDPPPPPPPVDPFERHPDDDQPQATQKASHNGKEEPLAKLFRVAVQGCYNDSRRALQKLPEEKRSAARLERKQYREGLVLLRDQRQRERNRARAAVNRELGRQVVKAQVA